MSQWIKPHKENYPKQPIAFKKERWKQANHLNTDSSERENNKREKEGGEQRKHIGTINGCFLLAFI